GEGFFLPALEVKREGRTCAAAVALVDVGLARALFEEAEVADAFDLGMIAQEAADLGGILSCTLHAQLQRLKAAHQLPRSVRIDDPAQRIAHRTDLAQQGLLAGEAAGDKVAMPSGIFGQAVDRNVGALVLRTCPKR